MHWVFTSPIAGMKQCATTAAAETARRLARQGVCDLSIGDVKFDTPHHIKQAAVRSIEADDTHYSAVPGTQALREAIAAKLRRENQLSYSTDEIVVGNGAGQVMFAALFATLSEGDEVIIPAPCWDNYADMVILNRGVPRFAHGEGGARVRMQDVIGAITERTRWIVLNNPNNPGGFVWTDSELHELATALARPGCNVAVMADETFEALCFGRQRSISFAALPGMRRRTLTVNGLSKSHAMAGWRIGYAAGPKELIDKIAVFNANTTYSLCNAAQAAAVAALEDSRETRSALARLKTQIAESRFAACSRLSLVSGVKFTWPDAGYFVLLDVRQLLASQHSPGLGFRTTQDICDYLIDRAKVVATDGAGFQAAGHIRLSFAGPEQLISTVYDRIVRALIAITALALVEAAASSVPAQDKAHAGLGARS